MSLLLVLLTSLLTCAGQLCQKQAARQTNRAKLTGWLIASLAMLGLGMIVWLLVLQRLPVSLAYPMLSINFILVALAARFIWHEKMTRWQWAGTVLIVAGVAIIGSYA
ncbi:4-amino-4-deoxy-L-arabinose-phosphoundecaprenol flippase subunit ArnE [Pantoea allii]|uniref:Undecaprenyl phosphate-alpha-L-ara4N flippase subunit ArnE n=1 Tax=Pantoea allii TaxID=574096 RepID=A0A2V2B740_9GAMM|nr:MULTISPECIES: 4-amino-4-deoxy-L-arabinose-phosphoundecaprenol flippase subunit ArnE [Pantoea]MBW1253972.1 4-amino-4-deoxy-L-arabinose-phosphoundecaprenol flippase subunit ArnE [Pantoea allii]MBW1263241.1 4-amino-4-deoxy-L-arabinose-phosphoundecaprenol flippase subunit ArnE [Pantoea allii]MBW1284944.1 4-amino-4-deoxy-L-arabinose-phosphoundecaprenol flippase subunit ArnE [Pantoea allii]MCH9298882.1 4-amino-4-deoxy-L-arabinose-phosphoundecaprenol flippase subunit ArnE [Pantoea allii]MDJ0035432